MKMFLCIESRIFFCTIINVMIIFHFTFKMLENPILKVELSRIKNEIYLHKCLILQNGLHVNELLIFNFVEP
jgi:membrane-bound acyltransferase YfiQ involved in biofilm formation